MKMKWKKWTSLALALTLSLSMAACGSSDGSAATDSSSGASADVTTYTVALSGQTTPFNYYDENGELDGYEVAMLKEIDARLDDLQFEYTTTEFASLFAGLDSGQFDLILNNITDKPERREKYLFSETPYYYNHTVIVTRWKIWQAARFPQRQVRPPICSCRTTTKRTRTRPFRSTMWRATLPRTFWLCTRAAMTR